MIAYLLKSALLLTILYCSFALLLSRETFHRFNRLALLCMLMASLLFPALQLSLHKPSILCYPKESAIRPQHKSEQARFSAQIDECQMLAFDEGLWVQPFFEDDVIDKLSAEVEDKASIPFFGPMVEKGIWLLYFAGLVFSVTFFLVQLIRFYQEVRGGIHVRDEFGDIVVIRSGDFAPYSFFHYIIISASDYEHLREPIMTHEQAHIRLGHSWDLLLLEFVKAIQWFNPVVYLLGRDLKYVHEYEADAAVLNFGIDAKTYQLLLVTKAVGNRLQTLANNLSHHSLKKRITMMHKNSSNRWLMAKGLILPALIALSVVAFAKPKAETLPVTDEPFNGVHGRTFKLDFSDSHDSSSAAEIVVRLSSTLIMKDGEPIEPGTGNWIDEIDFANVDVTADVEGNITQVDLHSKPRSIAQEGEFIDNDVIYSAVQQSAVFKGGSEACYKWLEKHIQYPAELIAKEVRGRVFVQFVVEKDGHITQPKVMRSPCEQLSEEALRVVGLMPVWEPAKNNGNPVRSFFILPIIFNLPDE